MLLYWYFSPKELRRSWIYQLGTAVDQTWNWLTADSAHNLPVCSTSYYGHQPLPTNDLIFLDTPKIFLVLKWQKCVFFFCSMMNVTFLLWQSGWWLYAALFLLYYALQSIIPRFRRNRESGSLQLSTLVCKSARGYEKRGKIERI